MAKNFEIPDHLAVSFFTSYVGGVPTSGKHATRCPVCGDSARRDDIKRMYLLDDNGWFVYCHNCGYSSSLYFFVRDFYPEHFDRFKSDCVSYNVLMNPIARPDTKKEDEVDRFKKLVQKRRKKKKKIIKGDEKTPVEKYLDKYCYPLLRDQGVSCQKKINRQRKYFLERGIAPDIVDSLYYCHSDRYKDRVIIPFFDKNKRIYYFQARSTMDHQQPKYLNWRDENDDESESKPEYNEHHVNKNEEVYIVEGLLDSLFVDNSVSTLGVSMSKEKIEYYCNKYPNRVFCMDNDESGWEKTFQLLKKNYKCLIFPSHFKHIKDLNDLAIEIGTRDLTEFVEKNSFQGVLGVAKMKQYGIIIKDGPKKKKFGGKHDILAKIKSIRRD
jgi:hypothetical protein